MDLFRSRPTQSFATAAAVAFTAHLLLWLLPADLHVFTLMQTVVAILALAGVMIMVVVHHRRGGGLLTHVQEERILIAVFGLFWLALLIAIRATYQNSTVSVRSGEASLSVVPPRGRPVQSQSGGQNGNQANRRPPRLTPGGRPWPCSRDDALCIVEEYYW